MFNRESDERLLIQFVEDQGFDIPELVEAARRLSVGLDDGLQDYSVPFDESASTGKVRKGIQ